MREVAEMAKQRELLIDERDRALVRYESVSQNNQGNLAGLAEAQAAHKAEMAAQIDQQKKTAAERDEIAARLERLKDSHKSQVDAVSREKLNLVEERDKAVVRLEKAQADLAAGTATFDKERQYLLKERDKAFAQLDEARTAQRQLEQALDEG